MDTFNNSELLTSLKKLVAEKKSLEERQEEYTRIINSRDNEIEMLHTMVSEANEYRSNVDNQLMQLKDLQLYLAELQQLVAGSVYTANGTQRQVGSTVSAVQQLQNLRQEHASLQLHLKDLQTQLQEVNKRNLLLQQQTSQLAELESSLQMATEEINKWRSMHQPPPKRR